MKQEVSMKINGVINTPVNALHHWNTDGNKSSEEWEDLTQVLIGRWGVLG